MKKIINFFTKLPKFNATNYRNLLKDDEKIADKTIKYGLLSLLCFFLIFLAFAFFMPLNSAVIAEGIVALDFNHKIIQHLEGGIVEKILVKEGDFVEQNQELIALSDVKSKSDKNSLQNKFWSMKLQQKRLIAEKNGIKEIDITQFLQEINQDGKNAELQEIILTQQQLFKARIEKFYGEIDMLQKNILEMQNQLISLQSQKKSSSQKVALISQELKMAQPLIESNNLSLTYKIDLEKQLADAKNQNLAIIVENDKIKQQIAQTKLQILNYKNENLSKILDEIKQTEAEISFAQNELAKVEDIDDRAIIMAPVAGSVMDIKYHTIGAVVAPASPIMTIVPNNDELIIEAKIRPQDRDSVHQKMPAKISLTAYKEKKVPKLQGEVIAISADAITNEQTKESYYLARIKIDESEVAKLKNAIEITPGMPAQVFIVKGSRSLIDYLISPIKDSAYKAFREE